MRKGSSLVWIGVLISGSASAQTNSLNKPETLPEIEVLQPEPKAKNSKAKVKENKTVKPGSASSGLPGSEVAIDRGVNSAQQPINPLDGIVPGNLLDFSSAASRVARQKIDGQIPLTTNDILQTVPGVGIINDDGLGVHGGIGIRGAPPRRSRKVLLMEDGRSINQSLWLDPSSEYVPPPDRIEQVEVLRGTTIVYGPNNNSGVVNFRNLQPFGPDESVVSGSFGIGGYSANTRHVHARRSSGDFGAVVSYSGADADGAWNTEQITYDDFYAALGWRGSQSDFTASAVFFRQRDHYDESNFSGTEEKFFNEVKHCKTCFNPGSDINIYNANILLLQGVYNYYVDPNTTVSMRIYGQLMDRYRYANFEGMDPLSFQQNYAPFLDGGDIYVPNGVMQGRLRTYNNIGTEARAEFANRPFLFGLWQDLQVGVRYERHEFDDRETFGDQGKVLDNFDSSGLTNFHREHVADAFSSFLQSDISVTSSLNLIPGVRLEHYSISRDTNSVLGSTKTKVVSCPQFGGEPCVVLGKFNDTPLTEAFTRTHVLPGVAFTWGLGPKTATMDGPAKADHKTTVYGGYHRGLTMGVLRTAAFPPGDELGDNYQIGVRSTALPGLTLDVAGFLQNVQEYQLRASTTTSTGQNVYTLIDEVQTSGVEVYARLDSKPFTGWELNPYAEGSFTFANSRIEEGVDRNGNSVAGNVLPGIPRERAHLTAGIESKNWNASVSGTYRGSFFTDETNVPFGGDPSGKTGEVPGVWLLSARVNFTVPGTGAEIFISGENLTDKLYITDREDGIKPGIGRTVMLGSRLKW